MGLKKLLVFSKKGRVILITSLFVLLLSVLGLFYIIFGPNWNFLDFFNKFQTKPQAVMVNEVDVDGEEDGLNCLDCSPHWLNGLLVPLEQTESFPVALVIDNDPAARPQVALSQADLVYEVPVEGGVTRFLAIYATELEIEKVGPIRSARSYYVTLAEELRAAFLHVGGSPESLEMIKKSSLYDLNEFYNENYFWRDNSGGRLAPHHIFTSSENWQKYLDNRGLKERQVESWLFKEESPSLEMSNDINIRFSNNFQALWRYSSEGNEYLRFFNGKEASDEITQIRAKNVIIQKVKSKVIDDLGRLDLNLYGTGEAVVCLDGSCQLAQWRKKDKDRTRYYYIDGEEVKLNPGKIWIEIAASTTQVSY
jgi:hypothetical protein